MIRKHFHKLKKLDKDKIVWRSHEVTRIEAFSDAVFGFAVSLLVISLEVPKTSKELFGSLRGLVPFAISFNVLFWIWRAQYKFFRRYGLHDTVTLGLNGVLLFIVLGFIYPLKFLFSSAFMPDTFIIQPGDYSSLFVLYNGGFVAIGFLFALMYYNAYLKKDAISLTPMEAFETVNSIWGFCFPGCVSLIVIIAAWVVRLNGGHAYIAYLAYGLLGIIMPVFDRIRNKQFKKKFGNVPVTEPMHNPEA